VTPDFDPNVPPSELEPGESYRFDFATVTSYAPIAPGLHQIQFATVNGFNVPEELISSNVFVIVFVPEPTSLALLSCLLLCIALRQTTPRH